jgi:hypothetical protein
MVEKESTVVTKRGIVMTGGGAKGLYEAGVIQALHLLGIEFDIVTGSSIGAMNALVYAEYLKRKRDITAASDVTPVQRVEAMDPFIRAFHHAWLRLETLDLIDESDTGTLVRIKREVERWNLWIASITRILWWQTSPVKRWWQLPWSDFAWVGLNAIRRLGWTESRQLLEAVKAGTFNAETFLSAYAQRLHLDAALVSAAREQNIETLFTSQEPLLQTRHLALGHTVSLDDAAQDGGVVIQLIRPDVTLKEYKQAGIDVRFTRANYRTGRLELSAYITAEDFVAYLENQAWRHKASLQFVTPLGSHRIHVPGNPLALKAALASGRFPAVFAPMPIDKIYDLNAPDNVLLKGLLHDWLNNVSVQHDMQAAYATLDSVDMTTADAQENWRKRLGGWRDAGLRSFFPTDKDAYLDGGAIDNTPTNSAIDAVREWVEREKRSKREVALDLYVVMLHPRPRVEPATDHGASLYATVNRTLQIMGVARMTSDAETVGTINRFGTQGEQLGRALQIVLDTVDEVLPDGTEAQRTAFETVLTRRLNAAKHPARQRQANGLVAQLRQWATNTIDKRLPVPVRTVMIYPDTMPMDTLQVTSRLGYKKENAIEMLTMGCYNTLWAIRRDLEQEQGEQTSAEALALARMWMNIPEWPRKDPVAQEQLRKHWKCQRESCVYHAHHCRHGKRMQQQQIEPDGLP